MGVLTVAVNAHNDRETAGYTAVDYVKHVSLCHRFVRHFDVR